MIQLIKKLYHNQIIRYLFIGVCTTLVNLILSFCFTNILGWTAKEHFVLSLVGNGISIASSILFAYVTNKIFVFSSKTNGWKELLMEFCQFVGGRLVTMGVELAGVPLLIFLLGQSDFVAKLEVQVIVLVGNYVISKFFVFKKKDK